MATAIMKQKGIPEMDDVEEIISKISEESPYKRRPTQKRIWMTVPEMGKDKVFLYKSGKAEPVEVTTGIRTDAEVQIVRGLQVGDTILTSGTLQLLSLIHI